MEALVTKAELRTSILNHVSQGQLSSSPNDSSSSFLLLPCSSLFHSSSWQLREPLGLKSTYLGSHPGKVVHHISASRKHVNSPEKEAGILWWCWWTESIQRNLKRVNFENYSLFATKKQQQPEVETELSDKLK